MNPPVPRSLPDFFDAIYVINLPERTDRRRETARQLARVGLRFGDGKVRLVAASRPADRGEFESIGAHGCFLSHLRVLTEAAERSFSRILVLEDDVDFSADFAPRVPGVLGALARNDWSLFYGGFRADTTRSIRLANGLAAIPPELSVETTHFVAFQGAAIAALVALLERFLGRRGGDPAGGPMHVDGAYNWYRRLHPAEVTLLAVPPLGHQRSSRSDVHGPAWKDRAPVLREAVAGLRRLRNRVRQW